MKFTTFFILICAVWQLNAQNSNVKIGGSFILEAPQMQTKKNIWVYLPKNYDSTDKHFPVLYVLGGLNGLGGSWNFEEPLMNTKIKSIVVGIEHQGEFTSLDEMERFLDFIATTLKPHIDKTYRTKTDGDDTALLGTGSAGLMAFYGALKYPKTFGKIGCFSPASGKYWQEIVNAMAKTTDFRLTNIYFLHGENAVEAAAYIEHWVNTKRCECKKRNKRVYAKGKADNADLWRDGFKKAYLWLF